MAEPIYKLKKGVNDIAIFENKYVNKDCSSDVFYSVTIQRSYKDKNTGQWQKQTISENSEGALLLADLIKEAGLKAIELEARNKEKAPF